MDERDNSVRQEKDSPENLILLPEKYFQGRLRGYGMFFGFRRKVKEQFIADIEGSVEKGVLHLEERLEFSDGRTSKRRYQIQQLSPGHYSLEGDDIIGDGSIHAVGNSLHWQYRLRLPFRKSQIVLTFDDWMYLQQDEVVLNRAWASKFGIPVGELFLTISKVRREG